MADEPAILNRRLLKLHALQPSVAKEAPLQQATPCQCTAQIGPIERDVAPRVDPVVVPGAHGCLAKVAVGEGASYNLAAPKTPIRTDRPVEATVSDGRVEEAQTGQARMTQVQPCQRTSRNCSSPLIISAVTPPAATRPTVLGSGKTIARRSARPSQVSMPSGRSPRTPIRNRSTSTAKARPSADIQRCCRALGFMAAVR